MKKQIKITRVVFVQKFVPHYRLPLFELLRTKLASENIEFVLIYGPPDPFEGSKVKMAHPEWGIRVDSSIFKIAKNKYLYYQGVLKYLRKGDVVIAEHASKLLDNYFLFLLQQIGFLHFGYFGHGHNFQKGSELKISALIKKLTVRRVAKWFAYTEMSAESLISQDVSADKIVVVNNSLARSNLIEEKSVKRSQNNFVYIGGMYSHKRLEFLFDACKMVHDRNPEFRLHMVGDGPDSKDVATFAEENTWCAHYGSLYGEERERLLYQCNAILMPGLVGLVAIDSFQFATPIISTDCGQHSPEVAYLTRGENAEIVEDADSVEDYAKAIERQLKDKAWSEKLRQGCRDAADLYTIENTADRFVSGILSIENS